MVAGDSQQFTASALDQYGDAYAASFNWSVAGGGSIDGSGRFTAAAEGGPYNVTASADGVSGAASVTVTPPPVLTSIQVSPASASVVAGDSQQFTASALDQYGDAYAAGLTCWWRAVAALMTQGGLQLPLRAARTA